LAVTLPRWKGWQRRSPSGVRVGFLSKLVLQTILPTCDDSLWYGGQSQVCRACVVGVRQCTAGEPAAMKAHIITTVCSRGTVSPTADIPLTSLATSKEVRPSGGPRQC